MKGFQIVLWAQAVYFSLGMILAVSAPSVREVIMTSDGVCAWVGIGLFVLGCIALRLAVHLQYTVPTALVLFGLYTTGLTLIGCQLAVWLQSDYALDSDVNLGLIRGQNAVCMGCVIMVLVFLIVQGRVIPHGQIHTRDSAMQAAALVLLCSGVCLVSIDDREWDWRYATAIFFALVISIYLNALSTWFDHMHGASKQEAFLLSASHEPFHVASLVILQPVLFAEEWLLLCLVG